MSDISSIWEKMQADDAAQRKKIIKRQQESGSGLGALVMVDPSARKAAAKKKGAKKAKKPTKRKVEEPAAAAAAPEPEAESTGPDKSKMCAATDPFPLPRSHPAARSFYDADDLLRHIQRDLNAMADDSMTARKRALQRLAALLVETKQPEETLRVRRRPPTRRSPGAERPRDDRADVSLTCHARTPMRRICSRR